MRWPAAAISRICPPARVAGADLITRALSGTSSSGSSSWTLTLERGIGQAYGSEAELQATGAFRAEVFPDLPIATTWQNLAKAVTGRLGASASATPSPPFTHYTTRPGALKVTTAAANLRTEHELEQRALQATSDGVAAAGGQRADVLLCVSGSHPVRSLPFMARFLRSSLDMLRVAQRLKQQGYIPPSTQLWVVANPNTEPNAALLEVKAELGASAVLTQPPLDWPRYLAWLDDAERRGLLSPAAPPPPPPPQTSPASSATETPSSPPSPAAPQTTATTAAAGGELRTVPAAAAAGLILQDMDPSQPLAADLAAQLAEPPAGDGGGGGGGGPLRLLVGHPVISSAANLSFWASLSGCAGSAAVQQLVAQAARAEVAGPEAAARHLAEYNTRLVRQVLDRGGAAGFHVMPITKAAKRTALRMLADGTLPPSSR